MLALENDLRFATKAFSCLTPRWISSYSGIEGGEAADDWAKGATARPMDAVPRGYLCETSFVHMTRMATEDWSTGVKKWVVDHTKSKRRKLHTAEGDEAPKRAEARPCIKDLFVFVRAAPPAHPAWGLLLRFPED